MRKATSGFTIVELLIVIVVIAILVAITVMAYNGIQARARDASNLSNANAIQKAVEAYKIDNNGVPPFCSGGNGSSCQFSTIVNQLVPTYASSLGNDPESSYIYLYVGTAVGNGSWAIRMYSRQAGAFCKTGVYSSTYDTWWSSAPKC